MPESPRERVPDRHDQRGGHRSERQQRGHGRGGDVEDPPPAPLFDPVTHWVVRS